MGVMIEVAQHAGFCFGVKRAVSMAFDAAQNGDARPLYTIGPLIHNPQVVKKLEEIGVRSLSTLEGIEEGRLIIRSHGVPPEVLEEAMAKGLEIIDATCPFVKKAQHKVAELVKEGLDIFIVGDAYHPEVKAMLGYGRGRARVLGFSSPSRSCKRVGIVCQTTQTKENLIAGAKRVLETEDGIEELRIYNTICASTLVRQRECKALAEESDIMIVVGGKNSANTRRLAQISRRILSDTYHIEGIKEVDPQWFRGKEKIGITAGASTPDWIIGEVVKGIKLITGGKI